MAKTRRPFNPTVLGELATPSIKALIGVGAVVWRYTVLVPIEETKLGENPQRIATDEDLDNLQTALARDFDGLTTLPHSLGYGRRESQLELNKHTPLVVYAAPTTPSDLYFQRLRKELEEALLQETILVERHEVWLH
jgi:hypothetical protein